MKFKIIVLQHRVVREEWTVDATNRAEAIDLHEQDCSSFVEEETIDTTDSQVHAVENLDDPDGTLELDEGL